MSSVPASVGVSAASTAFTPPAIDGNLTGRHIVSVEQFARPDLDDLIQSPRTCAPASADGDQSILKLCRRRIMATLFFEASTRTDMSFQAAMLRLGGEVVATAGGVQFSSVYKGENLADSVRAAGSYADVVVLRHPEVRSSYEAAYQLDQLRHPAGHAARSSSAAAMASASIPRRRCWTSSPSSTSRARADGLTVTLVGDLAHGRTVHSLAKLLALYGAEDLRLCSLVSPESLRAPAGCPRLRAGSWCRGPRDRLARRGHRRQ